MKVQKYSTLLFSVLFCLFSLTIFAQVPPPPPISVEEVFPASPYTPSSPITEITFEELEYDYGVIYSGEKVAHIYTFTNTGTEPLVLSNAKGSCGCTVPEWPKAPILPGETATIKVAFDSSNKSGKQIKTVTITANTNPAITILKIKGEVLREDAVKEMEDSKKGIDLTKTTIPVTENSKIEEHKDCFAVFPNPTSDLLKLDLKESLGKSATVRIYSPQGQLMVERVIKKVEGVTEFDVKEYAKGTYIASVLIEGREMVSQCFIVL